MDGLLAGKLTYVFVVSIFDAALLSCAALFWFRRTIQSLMSRRGGASTPAIPAQPPSPPPPTLGATATRAELRFALYEPASGPSVPREEATTPWRRSRLPLAYGLGALGYAIVVTALQFGGEASSLSWVIWLARIWENTWPVLPTLVALLVLDRRAQARLVGAYLAIGVAAVIVATFVSQAARGVVSLAPFTNVYWIVVSLAWTVAAPLAIIAVSGWRRIRSIMPLALAGTLTFGFALMLFNLGMTSVFDSDALRNVLLDLSGFASVRIVYYGLFLLLSLPVGYVAWRILRNLADRFDRKRFSDVQLVVDCWWAIVAAEQAVLLARTLGAMSLPGALATFCAYRGIVALVLRSPAAAQPARRLLLLRVFGYQSRTEALFDRAAQAWRFDGPVQLIAGVDLASRTVAPGDMLKLLSGRLDLQYIGDGADVAVRIGRLDGSQDPDGRFRINGVFCHDDTWRPAVQALLDASDCVLMDMRSFGEHNQGCVFELEQLVLRMPTDAIVLIIDRSTDLALLGTTLQRAWRNATDAAVARGDGTMALVRVERNSASELAVVLDRLRGFGTPQQVVSAAGLAPA